MRSLVLLALGTVLTALGAMPAGAVVFEDDFLSGGLSNWTESGGLVVNAAAGRSGPGLEMTAVDLSSTKRVVKAISSPPAAQWSLEFDFRILEDAAHPLEFSGVAPAGIMSAQAIAGGEAEITLIVVDLDPAAGVEDLRWRLRLEGDESENYFTLQDASAPKVAVNQWQHIQVVHTPASGDGADDGTIQLYVEGVPCAIRHVYKMNSDLQTQVVDFRIGLASNSTPFTGTFHFDNVVVDTPSPLIPIFPSETLGSDGRLFRVTFWQNGDPAQKSVVTGRADDLDPQGFATYPQGQVHVWTEPGPAGETRHFIEVLPSAGYGVFEVEHPLLVLNRLPGGEETLVVPDGYGRVIEGDLFDPTETPLAGLGAPPRTKPSLWYGTYGAKDQAMQLVLYENPSEGVMLWTPDAGLRVKDFEISRDSLCSDGLRAAVHHFPEPSGLPGTAWSAPHPVAVRPYTGGWHAAAKAYREWALAQSWASKGPLLRQIERGELPYWYRDNALWIQAIDENQLDLVDTLRGVFPGVELGLHLGGWQRNSLPLQTLDVRLPEYFPPNSHFDDETGCPDCWYSEEFIAREAQGFHVFPYVNAHIASIVSQSDPTPLVPTLHLTPPQADLQTADLMSQAPPASLAWGPYYQATNQAPMCRASPGWKDYFADLLFRNLKPFSTSFDPEFGGYGTDGHYLDQLVPGALFPCFATDHGHAPGFGSHHMGGAREMTQRVRSRHPNKILYGEGVFEGYIDSVQESYSTEPEFFREPRQLPLYAAVYHGYTSLHEWPVYVRVSDFQLHSFTAAVAASVHVGHKTGSFQSMAAWNTVVDRNAGTCRTTPSSALAACQYLQDLVALKAATMDVVDYGERLRDPLVTGSPTHTVTWHQNSLFNLPPLSQVRPVVEASLWASLAAPAKKLLLLSNSSASEQTVQIDAAELAPGVLHDLDGGTWTYSPGASIPVPAYSWRALHVQVDTDADGLLDEDDNCWETSNAGQADFDGDGAGDACDNCIETDNGPLALDAAGFSQRDTSGDGYGNRCDGDLDDDLDVDAEDQGIWADIAADPDDPRRFDADFDGDGDVDAADEAILMAATGLPPGPSDLADFDGDGVGDASDNCPQVANPTQSDSDSDGTGNACDPIQAPPFLGVAAEDGRVTESTETSNLGGSNSNGRIRAGDDRYQSFAERQIKGILSFDTSSLPDAATVTSATLTLKLDSTSGTSPFTTHGTAWVDIRTGGFGGSAALADGDFQAPASATQVGTLSPGATATAVLDANGRAAVNRTGRTQLRIYFTLDDNDDNGTDYVEYYDAGASGTANDPVLTIQYTLP